VPLQIVLNQTITEGLNPRGDLDVYDLVYSEGTLIEVLATAGAGGTSFYFADSNGFGVSGYGGGFPITTGRMTLPAGGTYHLFVDGSATTETPYTLEVRTVGSATETVSGSLSPGDSVSAETINHPGDVDDFVVNAAPGTEVSAFVSRANDLLRIDPIVAGTNALVRTGTTFNTGRVTVPPSGKVGIRIYELRSFSSGLSQNSFAFTGPYSVSVHQIDRAPETLPSAVAIGTTMNGESLDLEGDVDEFTFAGTAGQEVAGSISAPFALVNGEVTLEIVDPSTGSVLGSAASFDATVAATGPVSLPGTRTYVVRMRGTDSTTGKGGYRFVIQ
jgi:hypothetical protein